MSQLAPRFKRTTNRLLTQRGEAVTFVRGNEGAFVPSTGGVASGSATTFTGVAHPSPYSKDEIDGTIIKRSDVKIIVYTGSIPLVGDKVILRSKDYRIEHIDFISVEGTDIIYRCQLRA